MGSWVLLSRLPGLSAGLSLGSAAVAACKKKTWALAQIRCARAVVGHRGSLLPRHFGTSESRATGRISRLESVLVVHRAVGRKFPLGALQEQPPAERPHAQVNWPTDWWPRGAQPRRCSSGGDLGSLVPLSRLPRVRAGLSLVWPRRRPAHQDNPSPST